MYVPERIPPINPDKVLELVRQYNFATVITHGSIDLNISHLPLLFHPTSTNTGKLIGHMSAANPQWRSFSGGTPITAIFHGPHAYISPRWYEPAPDNVPTWNYCVVHMTGTARIIENPSESYQAINELVKNHDPTWPLKLSDRDQTMMMAGIRVFEIDVVNINANFKLSQNQSQTNRNSVISELAMSSDQLDNKVSQMMAQVFAKGHAQ